MALQFHESPFHATHDADTASKMALEMDLSIFITDCIKKNGPQAACCCGQAERNPVPKIRACKWLILDEAREWVQ
ncbi:Cro/CI family transcriptional regulator [Pseudomonas putida S11]|nr:Cro/CI family transcriptional regulator [Pseudomonas putida S11]